MAISVLADIFHKSGTISILTDISMIKLKGD